MAQVVSFVEYYPPPRYDDSPWTTVRVQEGTTQAGPWMLIDTQTLDPVDTDPTQPQSRSITTDDASDADGLWYRLIWVDAAGALSPTQPVQNEPAETLSALALCTDEDVRKYLGIKEVDLSDEDRQTMIRLVNAASQTYTDESQRVWKADPDYLGTRLYRLDRFDIQVGRLRIDDCVEVNSVGYGAYNDPLGPVEVAGESWYPWVEEPGWPITGIVFATGLYLTAGYVIEVDADWGWPEIPDKVRQDVIYTAAEWYARDVEKFSATFSLDQGRVLLPQVLPTQVQRSAESYRRWRVA